jgi:hypothetical protein
MLAQAGISRDIMQLIPASRYSLEGRNPMYLVRATEPGSMSLARRRESASRDHEQVPLKNWFPACGKCPAISTFQETPIPSPTKRCFPQLSEV